MDKEAGLIEDFYEVEAGAELCDGDIVCVFFFFNKLTEGVVHFDIDAGYGCVDRAGSGIGVDGKISPGVG